MKYLILFFIVFNVYFYFDIVSRYTLSNGIVKVFLLFFKNVNFKDLFRRFYNFILSKFENVDFRIKISNFVKKFLRKK